MTPWRRSMGVILTILALGWMAFTFIRSPGAPLASTSTMVGRPAPPFTLFDQHKRDLSLSDLRGDVVVLYFGYTHCPDTCPTTMLHMTRVKENLGLGVERVHFLFITVDPARDTPERLRQFLNAYDPEFHGLWGDLEVLKEVWRDYDVYANRELDPTFPDGYRMRHSWVSYVIDAKGYVQLVRVLDNPAEAVAAALRSLVRSGGGAPGSPEGARVGVSRGESRTAQQEGLSSTPPQREGNTRTVEMRDFRFAPSEIRIPRGTHVRFVNQEPVAHNVVQATTEMAATGPYGFRSPQMMRGESWTYRFDQSGEYPILCTVGGHHRMGMTGTIIVE